MKMILRCCAFIADSRSWDTGYIVSTKGTGWFGVWSGLFATGKKIIYSSRMFSNNGIMCVWHFKTRSSWMTGEQANLTDIFRRGRI